MMLDNFYSKLSKKDKELVVKRVSSYMGYQEALTREALLIMDPLVAIENGKATMHINTLSRLRLRVQKMIKKQA